LISRLELIPVERIENAIFFLRKQKVMIDSDLATLYGVKTRILIQAAKRNKDRFPADFMFRLTKQEFQALNFENAKQKGRGGRRYLPYAFTEHGVAMLSSVLNSKRAIETNIQIMRAFVRIRQWLMDRQEIAAKLNRHDYQFEIVFKVLEELKQEKALENKKGIRIKGFLT